MRAPLRNTDDESLIAMLLHLTLLILADLPGHHLYTFEGESPADRFGSALSGLGDVDGDGRADVLVGAWRGDGFVAHGGRAVAYSGATGEVLWELLGEQEFERLGFGLDAGLDLSGDGIGDAVVGSPSAQAGQGWVTVVRGDTGAIQLELPGFEAGADFGRAVALVEDVNGDGLAEVAVGAPFSDAGGLNAGRVTLHCGATGEELWSAVGGGFDQFGFALCGAGDLNADGCGDLWVGAPFEDAGAFNSGALHLLSGRDGARLWTVGGDEVGGQFGFDVARAGDVDGDGLLDVIAAAPGSDAGGLDSGAAEVRSGVDGSLVFGIAGEGPSEYLSAVAGVGDVDGDGRGDVAVGAAGAGKGEAGRVRVFSGSGSGLLQAFEGEGAHDWMGASLEGLGDVDGDGVPDLGAGAPVHDDDVDRPGQVRVHSIARLGLASDAHLLASAVGGAVELRVDAGVGRAGAPYLVLGSAAGAEPGFAIDGIEVALEPAGGWFLFTASHANSGPLENTAGVLDGQGTALARLTAPGGGAVPVGMQLHHAALVAGASGAMEFVSRSAPLTISP